MPWTIFNIYANIPAYLLVLFRIGGLVLAAPLFSSAVIPVRIRILLSMAVAGAVFPYASEHLTVPVTLGTAIPGLVGEAAIGVFIGFCLSLMFMSVQVATEFIAHQAGMSIGSVYNPMLDSSESVWSQLYYFTAMLGFLAIGGHRQLMRAVLDSFVTVPPLSFRVTENLVALVLDLLTASFEMAIRISGPTVIALMLTLIALGFISRTVPQLNILNIGFPLKLALAMLVMGLTVMTLEPLLLEAFDTGMDGVRAVLSVPARA